MDIFGSLILYLQTCPVCFVFVLFQHDMGTAHSHSFSRTVQETSILHFVCFFFDHYLWGVEHSLVNRIEGLMHRPVNASAWSMGWAPVVVFEERVPERKAQMCVQTNHGVTWSSVGPNLTSPVLLSFAAGGTRQHHGTRRGCSADRRRCSAAGCSLMCAPWCDAGWDGAPARTTVCECRARRAVPTPRLYLSLTETSIASTSSSGEQWPKLPVVSCCRTFHENGHVRVLNARGQNVRWRGEGIYWEGGGANFEVSKFVRWEASTSGSRLGDLDWCAKRLSGTAVRGSTPISWIVWRGPFSIVKFYFLACFDFHTVKISLEGTSKRVFSIVSPPRIGILWRGET